MNETLGPRTIDITGKQFGRFTVISYCGKVRGITTWKCRCECGQMRVVQRGNLFRPNASCGCYRKENISKIKKTHGMGKTRPYRIWANMINRCSNPKSNRSESYSLKGIHVCKKWLTFNGFWGEMKNGYSDSLSLERLDNDLGYNKTNCIWATDKIQQRNKDSTRWVTVKGRRECLSAWSEISGVDVRLIHKRLKKGWQPKRAIFEQPRKYTKKL